MTFKALLNFGGYHDAPAAPAMDRYHGGGGHYDHGHGWHGSKGKGGGHSGAALSALTLLAFLFLMNVMQQSLQENNATETTTATTIFLREDQQPISLTSRHDDNGNTEKEKTESSTKKEIKKDVSYAKTRKSSS